jgi:hypothetical protein
MPFGAPQSSFLTADAVLTCTNIDADQALSVISKILWTHSTCNGVRTIQVLICGLDILMRNNLFKLGDTFWLQLTGTAMGAPVPACVRASLCFADHELELLTHFQSSIAFHQRHTHG